MEPGFIGKLESGIYSLRRPTYQYNNGRWAVQKKNQHFQTRPWVFDKPTDIEQILRSQGFLDREGNLFYIKKAESLAEFRTLTGSLITKSFTPMQESQYQYIALHSTISYICKKKKKLSI